MAKESLETKIFSTKSDVWSFGITCLEILVSFNCKNTNERIFFFFFRTNTFKQTRRAPYYETPIAEFVKQYVELQQKLPNRIPNNVDPKIVKVLVDCWREGKMKETNTKIFTNVPIFPFLIRTNGKTFI